MTKQEFLDNVNAMLPEDEHLNEITDGKYAVIERVYNFHPSISDVNGKNEIAELFVRFGWSIINDMRPRADLMCRKEADLAQAKANLKSVEAEIETIRKGGGLY